MNKAGLLRRLQDARRAARAGGPAKHLPGEPDQAGGGRGGGDVLPALQRPDRRLPDRLLLGGVLQADRVPQVGGHAAVGQVRLHGRDTDRRRDHRLVGMGTTAYIPNQQG